MTTNDIDSERVKDQPHGWIQYKGTDICIDLHCNCGAHLHFDGDFLYAFTCGECSQTYELGANVLLYPVESTQFHVEEIKT